MIIGDTISNTLNNLKHKRYNYSVADEASITLPDATIGFGFVQAGDNEEYALFSWTSAGAPTLISNSANVVTTDTDTKLCILDGGTQINIKNRLGASKEIKYIIYYG